MTDQNLMDKSLRSVFVGNIPYEATEEKLKDIFSEAGPVLSFKLVYDRETGKPKGYGFCEYKDQETALSAMRNLNGYEIGGRTLRVDNACTEKSRMEMQMLLQGPAVENPYGDAVDPDKAPEAISKAVASLPPEQMFELMKQMKLCCQNNPTEARTMLMQNPQLAYALLQAQVVMRIVDPVTAASMLHKSNPIPKALAPSDKPMPPVSIPAPAPVPAPFVQPVRARPEFVPGQGEAWPAAGPNIPLPVPRPPQGGGMPMQPMQQMPPMQPMQQMPPMQPMQQMQQMPPMPPVGQDLDMRHLDPRASRPMDQDLRMPPMIPQPIPPRDPRAERAFPAPDGRDFEPTFTRDPRRDRDMRDPRGQFEQRPDPRAGPPVPMPVPQPRPVAPPPQPPPAARPATIPPAIGGGSASDQEKAQLIMQVLQLSDEQIAMLPPEQRQSILVLKEQIAKSTQR